MVPPAAMVVCAIVVVVMGRWRRIVEDMGGEREERVEQRSAAEGGFFVGSGSKMYNAQCSWGIDCGQRGNNEKVA